MHALIAY